MVPAPATDTVLLSERTDGDYIVRRYVVRNRGAADYSVRYRVNLATLNATLSSNSKELDDLNAFVDNLMKDTLLAVRSVTITGYSSPDGPLKLNETLAARRANDFKAYLDKKYDFSKKYDVTVNSVAEDWEMCRALVAQSSIPDKQAVLNVIDGPQSADQKEAALKKMPAAWNYMKAHILPPLRRVELTISYGDNNIVERRTPVPKPKPAPQPVQQPCRCVVVEDVATGMIVEMPDEGHAYRREMREESKQVRYEAREAQRIVRREAKAAQKIAKKEAKAAKKAEKAARKTYRELDRM